GSHHPVAEVGLTRDAALLDRLPEARPAGPGVELVVRGEERRAAARAAVGAARVVIVVAARERALRALLAEHGVLARGQARAPLGLAQLEALADRRIGEALGALGVVLRRRRARGRAAAA